MISEIFFSLFEKPAFGTFVESSSSCSIAAGRYISVDVSRTFLFFFARKLANFPAVVVLPAP